MDAEKVDKVEKGLAFCNSKAICSKCNYCLTEESEKACDDILHADALSVIRELKAENDRLKQEKADAVKRITEERDRVCAETHRDMCYRTDIPADNEAFEYYNGLGKALDIINTPSI